ncbi:hypothetical protein [Streptomyces sp. NPDC096132]|uniref:hypothetical protein n=1 Tax=Streptomyces sp. NPDC096132 TaxID=3366075 RepID=UPI0038169B86
MDIESLLAGPGDRTAALATSHGLRAADAAVRVAEAERFHEDKEDMVGKLTRRWGEPEHIGLQTVRLRTASEEIPEPWAELSLRVGSVYLWKVAEHGRWVALGVADQDPDDEMELLLVVTETDPP